MIHVRRIRGKEVDMHKAVEDLGVPEESLMKCNRPLLQEWVKEVTGENIRKAKDIPEGASSTGEESS